MRKIMCNNALLIGATILAFAIAFPRDDTLGDIQDIVPESTQIRELQLSRPLAPAPTVPTHYFLTAQDKLVGDSRLRGSPSAFQREVQPIVQADLAPAIAPPPPETTITAYRQQAQWPWAPQETAKAAAAAAKVVLNEATPMASPQPLVGLETQRQVQSLPQPLNLAAKEEAEARIQASQEVSGSLPVTQADVENAPVSPTTAVDPGGRLQSPSVAPAAADPTPAASATADAEEQVTMKSEEEPSVKQANARKKVEQKEAETAKALLKAEQAETQNHKKEEELQKVTNEEENEALLRAETVEQTPGKHHTAEEILQGLDNLENEKNNLESLKREMQDAKREMQDANAKYQSVNKQAEAAMQAKAEADKTLVQAEAALKQAAKDKMKASQGLAKARTAHELSVSNLKESRAKLENSKTLTKRAQDNVADINSLSQSIQSDR